MVNSLLHRILARNLSLLNIALVVVSELADDLLAGQENIVSVLSVEEMMSDMDIVVNVKVVLEEIKNISVKTATSPLWDINRLSSVLKVVGVDTSVTFLKKHLGKLKIAGCVAKSF